MVKEERVKQLYKIALFEQTEEKRNRQIRYYYKSDFISKEIIKSIFTGTFAFACLALLYLLSSWEEVLDSINNFEIIETAIRMILIYIPFLTVYLTITYFVYRSRYESGSKKLQQHSADLNEARKMFVREEKLKQ